MKRWLVPVCFALLCLACRRPTASSGGTEPDTDPPGRSTREVQLPLVRNIECKTHTASTSVSSTSTSLRVGEIVTVTVTVNNEGCVALGLPQYRLRLGSEETDSPLEPSDPDPIVHYLGIAPGQSDSTDYALRATQPGQVALSASVSFEVHLGYPGPAYWGNSGTGEVLVIAVSPD